MKIIGTDKNSVCVYCGQQTYGKGCPYSPSRTHVHIDDPKRCIYCGHTGFGHGCPYNPTSRMHVHGVEFNNAIAESITKTLTTQLFVTRLTQPITETTAYHLGLVDKHGYRLRQPETDGEKQAFSPLDAMIFRLKRFISEEQLKLLNASIVMEAIHRNHHKFDIQLHENEEIFRNRIQQLVNEYRAVISEAQQSGLTFDQLENIFVEVICDEN